MTDDEILALIEATDEGVGEREHIAELARIVRSLAGGGGGVPFGPAPIASFDFDEAIRVNAASGFVIASQGLDPGIALFRNGGGAFDRLVSLVVGDWTGLWTPDAVDGRAALVLPADIEQVFGGDVAVNQDSPVIAWLCKVSEVAADLPLFGVSSGDVPWVASYDDAGTVRLGVWFYLPLGVGPAVFRPTACPVDTELHAFGLDLGTGLAGLVRDGTLFPFTDSDPDGWDTRDSQYPTMDVFLGDNGGFYTGHPNATGGSYLQYGIYAAGSDVLDATLALKERRVPRSEFFEGTLTRKEDGSGTVYVLLGGDGSPYSVIP